MDGIDRKFCCSRQVKFQGNTNHSNVMTNCTTSLWCLPEEVLINILEKLHIKELLILASTHPYFNDLINSNTSLWYNVSFYDTWPSIPNMRHFMKAAEHNNIEALIKLGVAFLYNEGLPGDFEGKKVTVNGVRAAEMFCKVESCTPHTSSFTWLFIRPPWALVGACCKECVFNNMKQYVAVTPDPSVYISIAKTQGILSLDDYNHEIEDNLTKAKALGSQEAALLLWTQKYCQCCRMLDGGAELQSLRELRQIALSGYYDAQLVLCKRYVSGKFGGIDPHQAASFVRHFIQSSSRTYVKNIYRFNELTHAMRYILMDWLVEVACMKEFTSLTLHMAISVVDRFLKRYKMTRTKLQLLGVAAMVLCSRFLGLEIITIREAAWLTDNTYKYEDVVRMMGEVTAALHGNFRVPISLDYVDLMNTAAKSDNETVMLAEYFCELALLQSELGDFPMAEVAASCVLFSRLIQKLEDPWPSHLVQFTGYKMSNLQKCLLMLHDKCFTEQAMVDHRDVVLQAVKERYADDEFMSVSKIPIMSKLELRSHLSMPEEEPALIAPPVDQPCLVDLIASPCRNSSGRISLSMEDCSPESSARDQAATPTMEAMNRANRLNGSIISGYDGDLEDEGESFIEDTEMEHENLWSVNSTGTSTSMSDLPETNNSTITTNSVFGVTSGISALCSVKGMTSANLTKASLDTSGVSSIVKLELSSKLPGANMQWTVHHQLKKDQALLEPEPDEDNNCMFNTSPIDSGIDIISPTPGSSLSTINTSCMALLSQSVTTSIVPGVASVGFFSQTLEASGSIPLAACSYNMHTCSIHPAVAENKVEGQSASTLSLPIQDPTRKRTLSESVPSKINKMRIISAQSP